MLELWLLMRILVLLGGSSAEREVSLESGHAVAAALRERGHYVEELDPAETPVSGVSAADWDIAFPMVHGTGGEDGALQRDLQQTGLRWIGSSPEASELTFDKHRTAELLSQAGFRVPDHVVIRREFVDSVARLLRDYPVVVKPPRQGSSVGVSIVNTSEQLWSAFDLAFQFDHECLLQSFIAGREVTIPVVNGEALPAIEIVPHDEWYDYQAKYHDDRTQYIVAPADLPFDLDDVAVSACEQCGVSGIARVDFIVDNAGRSWLLEINTIPGMTSHSLVPKSAASIGISLGELCERAIS